MNEEVKETAREVKEKNFDLYIYNQIKNGVMPIKISEYSGESKQRISYRTNVLKGLGLIEKVGYGIWKVSKDLSEKEVKNILKSKKSKKNWIGTSQRPESNLHALQIKFPILSGKINDKDWKIKEKLKNWIPKYTTLKEFGGLKLKNNNNKSLTVWASSRDITNVDDVHNLGYQIRTYIYNYFKLKHNVILDHLNCETKNLDVATEDKVSESMRGKGEKFTLDLNKTAEKIFPNDKMKAKAWIDGSPYNFSAETNDLEWKREYLNMPFSIKHLVYSLPALEEYNKNLNLHIKVQKEQLETQKKIQKMLDLLSKRIA